MNNPKFKRESKFLLCKEKINADFSLFIFAVKYGYLIIITTV